MKAKEQGLSMVEMLGVLAIIGVLSIGGIAGYTMAMNRYKANEILDLASKLSVAAQTAASTADNMDVWNDAMRSVANEFGLKAQGGYGAGSIEVEGPYESTYAVWDDGAVSVYASPREGLGNAIDSITGIPQASHGGPHIIKNGLY